MSNPTLGISEENCEAIELHAVFTIDGHLIPTSYINRQGQEFTIENIEDYVSYQSINNSNIYAFKCCVKNHTVYLIQCDSKWLLCEID